MSGTGVSAILLAAGAGSRFGGGKLLAELNGVALVEHVLATLGASPVDETIVVVGAGAEGLREACELPAPATRLPSRLTGDKAVTRAGAASETYRASKDVA